MYELENSNTNSLDWHNCALMHRKSISVRCGTSTSNFTSSGQSRIDVQHNDFSWQYHTFSGRVLFQTERINKDMQGEVSGCNM